MSNDITIQYSKIISKNMSHKSTFKYNPQNDTDGHEMNTAEYIVIK